LAAAYVLIVHFSCAGGSCGSPHNVELCVASRVHDLIVRCDGKNDAAQYQSQAFPSLSACTDAGKLILNAAANPTKTVVSYRCLRR
jgi:hypothetical protein